MNTPFRGHDRDRRPDDGRWTEQGQDGGWYGEASRGPDRDGPYERNSPYARGQGGYAASPGFEGWRTRGDWGTQRDVDRAADDRGGDRHSGTWDRPNRGGSWGGSAFRAGADDDWTTRHGHERPEPSYATGRRESGRVGTHHEFEPDYLHWREQRMAAYDRDYSQWRDEKRQKFSSDFEGWRSSRGPQVQAENSVVGDVTDGGGGSQTHAREAHGDKPAKS